MRGRLRVLLVLWEEVIATLLLQKTLIILGCSYLIAFWPILSDLIRIVTFYIELFMLLILSIVMSVGRRNSMRANFGQKELLFVLVCRCGSLQMLVVRNSAHFCV